MNKVCTVLATVVAAVAALPYPEERLQHYEPPPQPQSFKHEPQPYEPEGQLFERDSEPQQYRSNPYKEKEPKKPYAFDYGVRDDYTGANYGHSETSNGNTIEGSYQVALPDGRIQIVKYVADHHNGFQAQVEYEGEARYPEYKPKEQSYKPEPHKADPYKPVYKPPPHKPQYKSAGGQQFHPNEPQPTYQEIPEEVPIFHVDPQEYAN